MKIVTSYQKPDIDGVACMYAYSELLNRQGEETEYFIWDKPKQEVTIVCDMFGITLSSLKEDEILENSEFVVVDLNGKDQLHNIVKEDKVVEIIDHHGLSRWLQSYTSIQRLQIDKVGAAATIVTERYKQSGLIPSRAAAILLFYGIISNSINLKSSLTKTRDKEACQWLKSICQDISEEKIKEIFIKKSRIEDCNLRYEMECEVPNTFPDFKVIIALLEVANLEEFLKDKKQKILKIMQSVKKEKQVNYIFINCIDILNGYIIVFAADEESREFVRKTFRYEFDQNNIAKINRIIPRKDMTAIMRKRYNPKIG